jgi:hypothetical protein
MNNSNIDNENLDHQSLENVSLENESFFINNNFCNDQPGRFMAVFLFGPILLYKSMVYNDYFIFIFAIILILWDFYHILNSKPNIYI